MPFPGRFHTGARRAVWPARPPSLDAEMIAQRQQEQEQHRRRTGELRAPQHGDTVRDHRLKARGRDAGNGQISVNAKQAAWIWSIAVRNIPNLGRSLLAERALRDGRKGALLRVSALFGSKPQDSSHPEERPLGRVSKDPLRRGKKDVPPNRASPGNTKSANSAFPSNSHCWKPAREMASRFLGPGMPA